MIRQILFLIVIIIGFYGCTEKNNLTDQYKGGALIKSSFPLLKPGQDTLEFIREINRYVVKHADVGNVSNFLCDSFYISTNTFDIDAYLQVFESNQGTAKCGLSALLMVKLLEVSGVDSYTYNFGFLESEAAHVLVIVKHRGKLLIYDPYLNFELINDEGKNLGLEEMIESIALGSESPIFKTDSTIAELLIDTSNFSVNERIALQEPDFDGLFSQGKWINDSVYLRNYARCFKCRTVFGEERFIRNFENKLKLETQFEHFYQALVLKINEVSGGANPGAVNSYIDSIIAIHFPSPRNEEYESEFIN